MTAVLLIIQLLIAAGLVGVILMQRSEGGALGIGGGGPGGMMSGRSAANLLTRVTMILGAAFMGNSILLAIVSGVTAENRGSVVDREQIEQSTDLPLGNLEGLGVEPADAPVDEIPTGDEPVDEEPPADIPEGDDAPAEDAHELPGR